MRYPDILSLSRFPLFKLDEIFFTGSFENISTPVPSLVVFDGIAIQLTIIIQFPITQQYHYENYDNLQVKVTSIILRSPNYVFI